MTKGNKYLNGEGHVSKTGKTIIRIAKNGRKYYHNPLTYQERKKRINEERIKEGLPPTGNDNVTRSKPYCYDNESPAYMRYYEKKCSIRNEYPKWVHMKREHWREYYSKVWDLIQYDSDYLQWKEESKNMDEKMLDLWWEEKNQKDKKYDGHGDEY